LTNKNVFNCLLNWQRLSDDRSEAGSLFHSRGPATCSSVSYTLDTNKSKINSSSSALKADKL